MIAAEHAALVSRKTRLDQMRARLLCRTALGGAVSVGMIGGAAQAGPVGGVVAGGQITIDTQGSHTQITQGSDRAIIEWQDFSIGQGESVSFAQPGRQSVALNKVMTQVPSEIAGQLTANGQVWIVNPNGVFVNRGAEINVGGMLATTAKIDNQVFEQGGSSFTGAPDGSQVRNAGEITAEGGSVVLVAPIVDNSGTITAKGGDVALGAGQAVAVDFHGDGLTRFEISAAPDAKLTNTGAISAQGGAVYLSAASSNAVQQSVVSVGGTVEATRIEDHGGVIVISGGERGVTEVTGALHAQGAEAKGGEIAVTGELVAMRPQAVIDASGAQGGGKVRIGADLRGATLTSPVVAKPGAPAAAPLPRARRTVVEAGARIAADAGTSGDGGSIVVWGSEAVGFAGAISAKGGATGGDGGFAEVSGDALGFDGMAELSAAFGIAGTLLLDPNNINIQTAGGANITTGDILFATENNDDLTVRPDAIIAVNGTLTLEARNNININDAINDTSAATVVSLVFRAGNDINIDASVTIAGDLSFTADADASGGGGSAPDGNGEIDFAGGTSLSAADITLISPEAITGADLVAGDDLTITSQGDVALDDVSVTGDLSISAVGSITDAVELDVTGTTTLLASDPGAGSFNITLNDADNSFGGAVSATGDTISLRDGAGAITLGDIGAAGNLVVQAAGTISDNAPTLAGTGIDVTGTTNLTTVAGEDILLGAAVHDFGGTVTVVDTGAQDVDVVTIRDTNALSVAAFTADEGVSLTAGAALTTGAITTGGDVTLTANGTATVAGVVTTGAVVIEGTDIALTGAINNASLTTIRNIAGGIGVGGATVDGFRLSDTEADLVNTDLVLDAAGDIEVNGLSFDQDLTLLADDDIAFLTTATTLTQTLTAVAGLTISQDVEIAVTGVFTGTTSGGDLVLDDAGNAFSSFAATAESTGVAANVAVTDGAGTLSLGDIDAADVTVVAAGAVTQTGGTTILATGTLDVVTEGAITLANAGNSLAVVATDTDGNASGNKFDVALRDASGTLELGATDAAGLTVTAVGAVTQTAATALLATGTTSVATEGAVTLANAGNQLAIIAADTDANASGNKFDVAVRDSAGTLELGATDAAALTVTAVGAVTQTAATALLSTGTTSVATEGAVTLANSGNQLAVFAADTDANASGNKFDVAVRDGAGALELGATDAAGLTVTAVGAVTQTAATALLATGTTSVSTEGAVTLANAGNQVAVFAADTDANASGNKFAVSVRDSAGDLELGAVDGSALTVVTTSGAITQTAASALVVTGLVDVTTAGGDVTLEEANDFGSLAVDATSAGAVSVVNSAAVELGDVVADSFTILADAGNLIQTTGTSIQANGLASLTATAGAVTLGDVTADSLTAFAGGGSLTQDTGTALDITTAVSATSVGGDVVLGNAGNDLPDVGNAGGGVVDVTATGGEVTLTDLDTLALGSIVADAATITADDFLNLNLAGLDLADGRLRLNNVNNGDIAFSDATLGAVFTDPVTAITDLTLGTGGAIESQGITQAGLTLTLDAGGAVSFTIAATAVDRLVVAGATTITQDAAGTIASGTATDLTASGAITLDAANDFASLSASGSDISVTDAGAITLAAITATGGLSVTAGGQIADTTGQAITVAGATTMTATGFDIALDNAATHDFDSDNNGGAVSADGANVTLVDQDAITLGAVTATGDLAVTAGTTIADSGAGVLVTGNTDLTATQSILLDDTVNDFGGVVSASGTNINLRDLNAIQLGEINASGTLTVRGSSISQVVTNVVGAGVEADDAFLISAGGVSLEDAENDFTGTVAIQGTTVSIRDTNAIQLGEINATTLTVQADAAITDANATVAGAGIEVTGTTTLTAGAAVTLDDAVNNFGGAVAASGTDLSLRDSNDLTVGDIDATGTLTLRAGGTLAQVATNVVGGDIDVAGVTDLTATGAITFDSIANNFGARVDASGTTISLRDRNALALGDIGASGDLTARSVGNLTDSGLGVSVTGVSSLVSDAAVTVDDATNDFTGAVSAAGTDIDLATSGNLLLGAVLASGDLGVVAGGTLADSGAGINVTGTTSVTATGDDVTLDDATNSFGGAISVTGADVAITDATGLQLGAIDATGTLTAISEGAISNTVGQTIAVDGATTLTASVGGVAADIVLVEPGHDFTGAVSLDGAAISVADANDLVLGAVDATGDLTVTAGGALADSGLGISVGGVTDVTATGDVTLDDLVNAFGGAVSASGEAIAISDADNLTVDVIDSQGDLTLISAGALSDSAGDVLADGTTVLQAGGALTLDNVGNTFGGRVDASGASISLSDSDALQLGTVASVGDLTITSGGAITDTGGQAISAGGATTLTAGAGADITLDNDDLHDFTGAVDFTGAAVTLGDTNQLSLGTGTADTLAVTANDLDITGAVTVGGGTGAVTIANDQGAIGLGDAVGAADAGQSPDFTFSSADAANLDAGAVTFTSDDGIVSNNFATGAGIGSVVLDAPSVTFTAAGGTDVFGGDLTLQVTDAVTQGAGDLTVGGNLLISAATGGVTLGETANDFQGLVTISASDIVLGDANDLLLGEIDATGDFTADVGGTLADSGASVIGDGIEIAGITSLTAGGPIVLDDAVNDFASRVDIDGGDVTLTDRGAITLGSVLATGNVVLTAGGAILDTTGLSIVINGLAELVAQSGINLFAIELDNLNVGAGAHDFGGVVSATGAAITLNDLNGLQLGQVSATSLSATAGSIADTGQGIGVTGNTVVSATGGITLDGATNNFGGTVAAEGADIALADTTALDLARIAAAGDFTAQSGAAISDTGAGVTVGGTTTLIAAAGSDVTLDDVANDFGGAVDAAGANIALADANDIVLGAVDATGNLQVIVGQGITDAGAGIAVAGTSDLQAGTDIALDGAANDFVGVVAADGAAISLADTNDLTLGAVTATGDLTLAAGGALADSGAGVTVAGATVASAGGSITLDDAANDFTGAVNADGTDVSLADANDIQLGDIAATGTLSVSAGGSVTDTGAVAAGAGVDVAGTSTLVAGGDILLSGVANDFVGAVATDGGAISLADANDLTLGRVQADAGLTVAVGGALDQTGDGITVAGLSDLSAVGDITLTTVGNDFQGSVAAAGDTIALVDANALQLALVDAAGDLSAQAITGSLTQTTDGVTVAGTSDFAAGTDIILDQATNDFTGAVDASGATVSLRDATNLTLGTVDATGDLTAQAGGALQLGALTVGGDLAALAGGAISDTTGLAISVTGASTLTATGFDITVDNGLHDFDVGGSSDRLDAEGATVSLSDLNALALGTVTATGDLTLATGAGLQFGTTQVGGDLVADAGGAVSDTDGQTITVAGASTMTAVGSDITLDTAGHDFDSDGTGDVVNATGANITLVDANDIALGAVDATGNFDLGAGGAVTQNASGVTIGGNTAIDATGFDVTLQTASNSFGGRVDLDGADLALTAAGAVQLGTVTATGDLDLAAGGAVSDTAGRSINVAGASTLTATGFDILLVTAGAHDFDSDGSGDAVSATGTNVTLRDVSAIVLGAVDATGNFDLGAGGAVTQDASGLAIGGTTAVDATGFDVALQTASNSFGGHVDLDGADLALTAAGAVQLGTVTATGDLDLAAGGAVSDTDGQTITVAGASTLTAVGSDITLDTAGHDFDSDGTGDVVNATGANITLVDANDIALGAVDASGDLVVTAGTGAIGDSAATVTVAGASTLTAQGDITLDNAANDFVGAVATDGGAISLADANDLTLGRVQADAGLTVAVGGALDQTGDGITVAGLSDLSAVGDITLTTVGNDFQGSVAAAGDTIALVDANALQLALVDAAGDLSAQAITGSLTQTTDGVTVAGTSDFAAGTDIILDQATNDFTGAVDASGATVSLRDATNLTLGTVDATGDLTAQAGGALQLGALTVGGDLAALAGGAISDTTGLAISVTGASTLTATGFDITVDNGLHDFDVGGSSDRLDAEGATVSLSDLNALALGTVTATGDLTLATGAGLQFGTTQVGGDLVADAGGAVSDTDGQTITVAGASTMTATGADITLDTAGHDFDSDGTGDVVNATGANITLVDANDIALGAVDASGDLVVTAGTGAIGDSAATVTVAGASTLTAQGDITLDNAANDFVGAVATDGGAISLADANDLTLGRVQADAGLTVAVGGALDQTGDGITVTGASNLSAVGDITLTTAGNDFQGSVAAAGDNIALVDANALQLARVDAAGDLSAQAITGSLTQTTDGVTVAGTSDFAAGTDIILDQATNDFTGAVDANGATVSLRDANALTLGDIAATGALNVTSGGTILQTGDGLDVAGDAFFNANNGLSDILLGTDGNSLRGTIRYIGQDVLIDLTQVDARFGTGYALGDASLSNLGAGGTVTLTQRLFTQGNLAVDTDGNLLLLGGAGLDVGQPSVNGVAITGLDPAVINDARFARTLLLSAGGISLTSRSGTLVPLGSGILRAAQPFQSNVTVGGQAIDVAAARGGDATLTPQAAAGDAINLDVAQAFTLVGGAAQDTPFTLDTGLGQTSRIRVDSGTLAIGDNTFLNNVAGAAFNPFVTGNTDLRNQQNLFLVTGDLVLAAGSGRPQVHIANTTTAANQGFGTVVDGQTTIEGAFARLSLFGKFGGIDGTSAAFSGFRAGAGFVANQDLTVNGCVILTVGNCTPIGQIALRFEFNNGDLLAVRFIDPSEDEDDPFTNRGDEEDWQ